METYVKYAEDFLFTIETLNVSKNLYLINEPYYHYIVNSDSATQAYGGFEKILNRIDNILVANTRVYDLLGRQENQLLKYKNKIENMLEEKIGLLAVNEKYKSYKKIIKNIEQLTSFKEYCTITRRSTVLKNNLLTYLKLKSK